MAGGWCEMVFRCLPAQSILWFHGSVLDLHCAFGNMGLFPNPCCFPAALLLGLVARSCAPCLCLRVLPPPSALPPGFLNTPLWLCGFPGAPVVAAQLLDGRERPWHFPFISPSHRAFLHFLSCWAIRSRAGETLALLFPCAGVGFNLHEAPVLLWSWHPVSGHFPCSLRDSIFCCWQFPALVF